MTHFGRLGPWYTGADADLGAGDMIKPGHGSKRRAPGGKLVWMHEDPAEAQSYGAHLYQVEPTGILYDDSGDGGPGSWSHAGPASGAYGTETRTMTRATASSRPKVRERHLERPFAEEYQVAGSATGAASRTACRRSRAAVERRPAGVSPRWSSASTSSAPAESTTTRSAPAKTCT